MISFLRYFFAALLGGSVSQVFFHANDADPTYAIVMAGVGIASAFLHGIFADLDSY